MPFWLRLTIFTIACGILLIWAFGFGWQTGISLFLLFAAVLPPIIRNTPRLYLTLQRVWYYLKNADTNWELNLQFRGAFDRERIDAFVRKLIADHSSESMLLQESSGRYLIRLNRIFTVEFVLGPADRVLTGHGKADGEVHALDVTMFEQQVGYRRSKKMLEETLIPFIGRLRGDFVPVSSHYALRVKFEGTNPFLGLYLQHLKPEAVKDFQFTFTLPQTAPGDYVRVDKAKMEVNASEIENFRRAVLAGLTFSAASR